MRKLIALLAELSIVIAAVFLGDFIQAKGNVIPRSIIHLPQVDYSRSDFWVVLNYFLLLHFLAFLSMQYIKGPWKFSDAKRTSDEIFALVAIYSVSTLLVFITTTVNFDPDFMVAIGISSILLFILLHFISSLSVGTRLLNRLILFFTSLFSRLLTISGVLILVLSLIPPLLAYVFTTNRDVANIITQIRIKSNDLFSSNYQYELISATGNLLFKQPILAKTPPQDPSTLFILERSGRLISLDYPVTSNAEPKLILDIQDKVGYVEIENGALGFAFHPEYGNQNSINSGFIYIYYTDVRNGTQTNRISRFNIALSTEEEIQHSETPLLALQREPSGFHNGGSVEFGPDGYLYIALGEGVHLEEKSQAQTLRQGILRIDINQKGDNISAPILTQPANGEASNYFIPLNNPFINNKYIRNEYWAIGLRNPFRISFDSHTGNLWAGDVGSTKWEEVNLIIKGRHYQFPNTEGYEKTDATQLETFDIPEEPPIYTYLHTAYDRAVIGGVVYRGNQLPELKGKYIFADNYSSKLFSMPSNGNRIDTVTEIAKATQFAQRGISSVVEIGNGDLIVTTLGRSSQPTGEVLKLTHADGKKLFSAKNKLAVNSQQTNISLKEATEIFVTNCARCHGSDGKGHGPDSNLLGVSIPDFTNGKFQATRTDEKIREVIKKGGMQMGLNPAMPPWEGILTIEEINALTKLIRESITKE
ncbi:MAG: PQQ-dependent sugar dehydrogenase [Pseudomonadales bacterium]|nr:PQQ-dependent sugar dehydrogenase [Pseudomonadales bacterium]